MVKQNAEGRLRALTQMQRRRSNIPVEASLQVQKDLGMKLAMRVANSREWRWTTPVTKRGEHLQGFAVEF